MDQNINTIFKRLNSLYFMAFDYHCFTNCTSKLKFLFARKSHSKLGNTIGQGRWCNPNGKWNPHHLGGIKEAHGWFSAGQTSAILQELAYHSCWKLTRMCVNTFPISGPWFNIKMSSYQYRKPRCGDKMILWPSYLHNGVSYTGKMTSLYWVRTLVISINWLYIILNIVSMILYIKVSIKCLLNL